MDRISYAELLVELNYVSSDLKDCINDKHELAEFADDLSDEEWSTLKIARFVKEESYVESDDYSFYMDTILFALRNASDGGCGDEHAELMYIFLQLSVEEMNRILDYEFN